MVRLIARLSRQQITDAVELGVGEFTRAYMLWEYAVSGTYNPNVIIDFEDLIIEL